jgi:diguanylate cyclase (GGDEF)-like protein/PAS domain S-box-containing protein
MTPPVPAVDQLEDPYVGGLVEHADVLAGLPAVHSVYQPIVDLVDGATVAYEALVRGRAGTDLHTPQQLFGWAGEHDRVGDLDWACRFSAVSGATGHGLPAGTGLFVNVEPAVLGSHRAMLVDTLAELAERSGLRLVVEVTERSLAVDLGSLLRFTDEVRARGWAVAVDDVGADPASLALMPFLEPDLVKLDLGLIQQRTTVDTARIVNAVTAQAQRTGALVLAEGIETPEHDELARSMGAHLGQGWWYGRPGPLPEVPVAEPLRLVHGASRTRTVPVAPWELVRNAPAVRRARKPLLAAMSRHLERQAFAGDEATVVLGAFQHHRFLTPATAQRYSGMAANAFLVAGFGEDVPTTPVGGVRGQHLAADDPLRDEWTVVVVSPHFAGALIAHDVGDAAAEDERRFDYVVTFDRDTVLDAASSLLRRLDRSEHAPALGAAPEPAQPTRLELLTRAMEATTNGILIADARAEGEPIIYANPGFARLTGYPLEETLGRHARFLRGPGTDHEAGERLARLAATGESGIVTLLNYRRDGTPWWCEVHLSSITDGMGRVTHHVSVQNDITDRVEAERRAERLATTDGLTGLMNRTEGTRRLDELTAVQDPGAAAPVEDVLVLFCDLDGFKAVNDRLGHLHGDTLLRRVADGLAAAVGDDDAVFRFGGDEFVVLTRAARDEARAHGERLAAAIHRVVTTVGSASGVGVSVGVAVCGADGTTTSDVLRAADRAMYRAKQRGGGSVVWAGELTGD